MASVFKIHVTRYIDAAGRQTRKGAPDAQPKRQKSRKWYGEYADEQGLVRRVPLSSDKSSAQAMLNQLVQQAARRQAGLFDQYEVHERRPLSEHVDDFQRFLASKNNTPDYVQQTTNRIRCLMEGCDFQRLSQISAPEIAEWLARQRQERKRFSIQTSNFYLEAAKAFCAWLERHDRIAKSSLVSLKSLNVDLDRRHHRRSLSEEAFERLIAAAAQGDAVQEVDGAERAVLYIVAAWTGYRRRELASLTRRSLKLDADLPIVQVTAGYSKRRRYDSQPLHPEVVRRLREWLADKNLRPQDPLFHLTTPGGSLRRTSKMMRADLAAARKQWLEEATTPEERERRKASDFLTYCDAEGLFADFHANRHTFISRLGRSGVSLLTAQKLARHSDPRLTANVYNHLDEAEKAAAIELLPGPKPTSGAASDDVPVAAIVAGTPAREGQLASTSVTSEPAGAGGGTIGKSLAEGELVPLCQLLSAAGFMPTSVLETTAPGLKNRGLNDASPGPKFSLRAILIVTALGAVVAAAAGMAYRAAPAESRAMLLTCWLTIAAMFAAYLAFQWRAHRRRLSLAGPIRFTLQRPDLRNDSNAALILAAVVFLCFVSLLLFSLFITVFFTLQLIDVQGGPGVVPTSYFGGIFGFMMVAATHFLYRPRAHSRPILLVDHGVIVRRRVLRWDSFKRASWHHLLPNWLMLYGSGKKYAAAVPDAWKTEVETFVAARTRFEVDQTKLSPGR